MEGYLKYTTAVMIFKYKALDVGFQKKVKIILLINGFLKTVTLEEYGAKNLKPMQWVIIDCVQVFNVLSFLLH